MADYSCCSFYSWVGWSTGLFWTWISVSSFAPLAESAAIKADVSKKTTIEPFLVSIEGAHSTVSSTLALSTAQACVLLLGSS